MRLGGDHCRIAGHLPARRFIMAREAGANDLRCRQKACSALNKHAMESAEAASNPAH